MDNAHIVLKGIEYFSFGAGSLLLANALKLSPIKLPLDPLQSVFLGAPLFTTALLIMALVK